MVSAPTLFTSGRSNFGGISVTDARTLKLMEKENAKLKKMIAELLLDKTMLQEVIAKKT
jgi:putative transposase